MKQREYNVDVHLRFDGVSVTELKELEAYIIDGFEGKSWKLFDLNFVVTEGRDRVTKGKKSVSKEDLLSLEKSKGTSCS